MMALARSVASAVGASRATVSTASSGHSPLTFDGDLDADSVFDSPPVFALTVMHHDEALAQQDACGCYIGPGDCGSQDDLLSLPLQDPAETYASPAGLQQDLLSQPLHDLAGLSFSPSQDHPQQDLLALPDFGEMFASPVLCPQQDVLSMPLQEVGPYPSVCAVHTLDRRKGDELFHSERDLDRHRVCMATSRTSRKLERFLSEPHGPHQFR